MNVKNCTFHLEETLILALEKLKGNKVWFDEIIYRGESESCEVINHAGVDVLVSNCTITTGMIYVNGETPMEYLFNQDGINEIRMENNVIVVIELIRNGMLRKSSITLSSDANV